MRRDRGFVKQRNGGRLKGKERTGEDTERGM